MAFFDEQLGLPGLAELLLIHSPEPRDNLLAEGKAEAAPGGRRSRLLQLDARSGFLEL